MTGIKYQRSSEAIFAEVGSDVVALHVGRGKCYGMENVSSAIWALLAEPIDLDRLCVSLVEQYNVDPEQCRAETAQLLDQMVDEGLVSAA